MIYLAITFLAYCYAERVIEKAGEETKKLQDKKL